MPIDIHEARMARWADTFADIYIRNGEEAAAEWAAANIPAKYHGQLHSYVKVAFDNRGYELHYPDGKEMG